MCLCSVRRALENTCQPVGGDAADAILTYGRGLMQVRPSRILCPIKGRSKTYLLDLATMHCQYCGQWCASRGILDCHHIWPSTFRGGDTCLVRDLMVDEKKTIVNSQANSACPSFISELRNLLGEIVSEIVERRLESRSAGTTFIALVK